MASRPRIESYVELDSTNAEARRRAEAGEAGPVWIAAGVQTAGRGRRGRPWSTETGNLAATLLTLTDRPPAEAAQLSFVAALAACDLADTCLGPGAARLKWPNDVLVHGRKAVGILVESGARPDGRLWLAVGVGVNLKHAPQDLERPATAFADYMAGPPPEPLVALDVLAQAFERWRSLWATQGFAPIAAGWSERAVGLGERCVARLPNRTVEGVAEGMDPDGALRLRLDDGGLERITAGDVFFGGT
ncbi:MAG: biotin--[acetyl-CoA-carboxylase] ligase [Phenylobacterium sp.]|uniref:biotin--[acetyl-CoA-carboxylase] ligase n=1 Tax=unclassified Phenylobacterium TaxID=2640670 RepID=UPI0008D6E973|nr:MULTISPECIES: biotin--[acetyl-CoA-carboxylase] ligase [unclassified Phenylobacterium]MBJ7410486.1 biotin--[acetyl-CoA-carboxylase] ligase [Phenylobacterium sp.]OHB28044.1 MAG: biotin--[acetyl-CoA-carboxylase] ligase [Phenylobacterium sp. RIFCSPHIGHO2_01_FULL_69_31]